MAATDIKKRFTFMAFCKDVMKENPRFTTNTNGKTGEEFHSLKFRNTPGPDGYPTNVQYGRSIAGYSMQDILNEKDFLEVGEMENGNYVLYKPNTEAIGVEMNVF